MPTLIDLSIPVRHGDGRLGLEVAFSTPYSFETCGWQGSSFSMFAHYATHVDAPNHFIEGAHGIDQAPIGKLMTNLTALLLILPPLSWLMRRSGRARGGSSFGCGKAIGRAGACG